MKETVLILAAIALLVILALRLRIRFMILFDGEWKVKLRYLFFSKKLYPARGKEKRSNPEKRPSHDRIFPDSAVRKLRDMPKTIASLSSFFGKHFPSLTLRIRSLYLVVGLSDAALTAGACTAVYATGNLFFSFLDEFLPCFIVDNSAVFPDYSRKRFDYELFFIVSVSAFDALRFFFHVLTGSLHLRSRTPKEKERSFT